MSTGSKNVYKVEQCTFYYSISLVTTREALISQHEGVCVLGCCPVRGERRYVAGPAAVVRAPHFDSAVIKSDRLGGNFAYSHAESHAYAAINPVVENVVAPVGVSYSAHTVTAPVAVPAVAHYAAVAAPAHYAAPLGYAAHYYR
ncbi:hypothetical protein L9F63_007158 [Diploptera punctata]|uniref:Uncharacterized protein n=1 Tax=Diploptera punctata TaxID=6984 RepID=A0AAD8E415_DIPPU|nr:hypothetical protein L9F63_007158 [Diploptera punctata]